ncbi:DUF4190 domain-containing protein [Microlunatus ginsengisoli]|uniref:DUF4190 domain-containing protein n=1 Tax=Microlunatus ginsengisoli TaxID=363863 RepID=A0ABP6ZFQ8_9ACTN
MTEPNPWSREGAAGAPHPPSGSDPAAADPAPAVQAWPAYPPAPNSFGYDTEDIPDYPGASSDPTAPHAAANPYEPNPPAQTPYSQHPRAQNPYDQTPYPQSPYGSQPIPYGGTTPYGPSAYRYATGPYGYTATAHPQAVTALVLGVIGLVICSVAGIAAFFVGQKARREILAEPQRYSGLGMATAGWVMGMIAFAITLLGVLFVVIGLAGGWD